ncbi:MAG TPA: alpha/beta hydrolase [Thermoleophilaceae bacterium]
MVLDQHRGGSGEPLVLVHGIGHTWRGWKPMLPGLEQRFEVLGVDLPGFGHSPPLPAGTPYSIDAFADAVEEAFEAAGFDRPLVCGNSLGGWTALELARRGSVRGVVGISPAGLMAPREAEWATIVLNSMRNMVKGAPLAAPLLRTTVGRTLLAGPSLGKPWRADPEDLIEQAELLANAPAWEPTLAELKPDGHVAGLDEIRCPVLILWGTRDVILIPRQGRRFERLIPDAELKYLKGLGHVPMSDAPELLVREIVDFAARVSSPVAATA